MTIFRSKLLWGAVAIGAVMYVTRFRTHVEGMPVAVAPVAAPAAPPAPEFVATPVSARLNFSAGQMELRSHLRSTAPAKPDRVWLWAYFINPTLEASGGGSWSDEPIAVTVDWKGLDTVTVRGRGPFHWHNTSGLPRSGYMARVLTSPVSAEAVVIRPSDRNKSPSIMISVD